MSKEHWVFDYWDGPDGRVTAGSTYPVDTADEAKALAEQVVGTCKYAEVVGALALEFPDGILNKNEKVLASFGRVPDHIKWQ